MNGPNFWGQFRKERAFLRQMLIICFFDRFVCRKIGRPFDRIVKACQKAVQIAVVIQIFAAESQSGQNCNQN